MANDIQTIPAHIAARIAGRKASGAKSAIAQAILGDSMQFPRISVRAGRYRLVEEGVETPVGITLDVIVVGANPKVSKIFYSKAYDQAADNVRPDCSSTNGTTPDANIENPVSPGCANCPNNVLGSKITPSGAKSKLCADQRHIAVIAAADPNKVYGLTVPVSGMKGLREYLKELDNFGTAPEEVITELGFDEQASFPKITFKRKGYVPDKFLGKIDGIVGSDDVKIAVRLMAPTGAPSSTGLAAPPAPAAIAVDDAYEEQAAPAPAPAPAAAKAEKAKPVVTPVKSSSELEAKLDNLFSE